MLLTKKPSAIVYNWYKFGTFTLRSEIYYQENLFDEVVVYSLDGSRSVEEDFSEYHPDVIISFVKDLDIKDPVIKPLYFKYESVIDEIIMANDIVVQSTFRNCTYYRPKFSVFTPTYNTGERIRRTYQSLVDQICNSWEWVVTDESTDNVTWEILEEIAAKDFRVKIHRILPPSGGNIGLVKNRAANLCDGQWFVELDHDDTLLSQCLEYLDRATKRFPDAGFIYSDQAQIYADGSQKMYDSHTDGNWYGRPGNGFAFGYAGHSWVEEDGIRMLAHHYPDINPLTIRFNISMPSHVRAWRRDIYQSIGGHNKRTPIADDFEIIIRTFLKTKMVHIKKVLYIQWDDQKSASNSNATDINRRSRLIRDHYDEDIHKRILQLGKKDWNWDEIEGHSQKFQNDVWIKKFNEEEERLNYVYRELN
jgi:glycosyltransferase involved in cell wall biosynthesis